MRSTLSAIFCEFPFERGEERSDGRVRLLSSGSLALLWSDDARRALSLSLPFSYHTTNRARIYPSPVHLPKIWENSSSRINVTTVTEPIYSTLDSFDTGYYEASARWVFLAKYWVLLVSLALRSSVSYVSLFLSLSISIFRTPAHPTLGVSSFLLLSTSIPPTPPHPISTPPHSELRVKLKSRQTMIEATGEANVNFTATDVVTNNCKEINQKALDWALANAGATALARYKKLGVPMVMGDDLGPYNAGPLWIYNSMKYEMAKDKSKYTVQAPMMHTPDNYSISAAAGFHYCKVLSPARALEWIMIDSLRTRGGL